MTTSCDQMIISFLKFRYGLNIFYKISLFSIYLEFSLLKLTHMAK